MLAKLLTGLGAVIVLYLSRNIIESTYAWIRASRYVGQSPIPYVTIYSPVDSAIFWLLSPYIAPYLESLPFGLGNWVRFVKKDFTWHGKGDHSRDYFKSDAWWTVGPGGLMLQVGDPELFAEVTSRWKDFPKQTLGYDVLNPFGRNVVTTEGKEWQMHRKITAPPFNERNNSLVFTESLRQAKAMLYSFTHDTNGTVEALPINNLADWTMTLALDVICGAGFGAKVQWPVKSIEDFDETTSGSEMSFAKAVRLVATNTYLILLFPKWLLRNSPWALHREVLQAAEVFESNLHKMMNEAEQGEGKTDLLTSLVDNSKGEMKQEEMMGNLFIVVMAGHETTAAALQTLFIMLACEQEVQNWILEEIDQIHSNHDELDYAEDWLKMERIVSAVLEILRLFPPIVTFPKTTITAQSVTYKSQTFDIPPNTTISCDVVALNRHPQSWAPDPHIFRPSRWIVDDDYIPAKNGILLHEKLYRPPKGTFATFSEAARSCLGRKFALVEMATVLTTLLRQHKVELVDRTEGGVKEARRRLDNRRTLLAMRMMQEVEVRFVRRD